MTEQRKHGADVSKDMVFELLKQHLVEDDNELNKIHDEYSSGKMSSGELKLIACELLTTFMDDFVKKLEKARKNRDKLHFVHFN